MTPTLLSALMIALAMTGGVALAQEERSSFTDITSKLGTQGRHVRPKPDCMCRLRSGQRVPLRTRTCIRIGDRAFTAECRLSQNVSTWREIAKGCPVS